jgi:hypothetical protein
MKNMSKKLFVIIAICVSFCISCATRSSSGYKMMSISEFESKVKNNPFNIGIVNPYKFISDAYIKSCRSGYDNSYFVSLVDVNTGKNYRANFNENINGRFDPNVIYKVYLSVPYNSGWLQEYEIDKMVIDNIEGLLTVEEYKAIITNEENERRQREEIARQEQLALIEKEFKNVIAYRNPVSIMEYLRSENLTSLSSTDRSAIIQKGQLEVAKILTGNNNVKISGFLTAWERYWGHSGRITPFNPGAFEEGVVYTGVIIPDQFIDGIIYSQLSDTPESSVLYRNVSAQDIRSVIQDVLMVYIGQMPVRLTNGRTIRLPLFDVLYYRK